MRNSSNSKRTCLEKIEMLFNALGSLWYLWPFFLMAFLSCITLGFINQTLEIYDVFNVDKSVLVKFLGTLFLVSLLSFYIYVPSFLVSFYLLNRDESKNRKVNDVCLRLTLYVLSFGPWLGVIINLVKALGWVDVSGSRNTIKIMIFMTFIACLITYYCFWFFTLQLDKKKKLKEKKVKERYAGKEKEISAVFSLFDIMSYSRLALLVPFFLILVSSLPLLNESDYIIFSFFLCVGYYFILIIQCLMISPSFSKLDASKAAVTEKQKEKMHQFFKLLFFSPALFSFLLWVAKFKFEINCPFPKHIASPGIQAIVTITAFFIAIVSIALPVYWAGHLLNLNSTVFMGFVLIIFLTFFISSFDWNDNHQINLISDEISEDLLGLNNPDKGLKSLNDSFFEWIKIREKDNLIQASKYPIYVISAQGGGIFAAYHAASTLSRLQDFCPAFASHIFAISGVSGGSLGAAVFSSLVKHLSNDIHKHECSISLPDKLEYGRGPLEEKAHAILKTDLLSPVLRVGLMSDFFQHFIPIPVESIDRSRGLERAFEQAWEEVIKDTDDNPFKASFYSHWSPENNAPALVLNTTAVESGKRLLLSPFMFKQEKSSSLLFPPLEDISTVACKVDENGDVNDTGKRIDFSLSTAAILSARFPVITSAGWFSNCQHETNTSTFKSRLVDGGYFENSGFFTAFDIGQRLQRIIKLNQQLDARFKIVYLALTNSKVSAESKGLNASTIPFTAFANARDSYARGVIEQAEYIIENNKPEETLKDNNPEETLNDNKMPSHSFRQFYLTYAPVSSPEKSDSVERIQECSLDSKKSLCNSGSASNHSPNGFKLPLGWYLSPFSQDYIRKRIGNPNTNDSDCSLSLPGKYNNHCVMKSIIDELSLGLPSS